MLIQSEHSPIQGVCCDAVEVPTSEPDWVPIIKPKSPTPFALPLLALVADTHRVKRAEDGVGLRRVEPRVARDVDGSLREGVL